MSTEIATQTNTTEISFNEVPDYLKDSGETGLEGLGKEDIKLPRIKIIQGMSPEVRTFAGKAIPGAIWHTAMNGPMKAPLRFIPISASKKVFVWTPKKDGGEMVAFSSNAKDWDRGANTEHKVDSVRKGQVWQIGKDVASSGLLEFGSSNSEEDNSAPAATLIYEYLCYLPDFPQYSPVAMSISKTGLGIAKSFNTSMLMLRKPIASIMCTLSVGEQSADDNTWFVPKIELNGFAPKELYMAATAMQTQFKEYKVDYNPDEDNHAVKQASPSAKSEPIDDQIPF